MRCPLPIYGRSVYTTWLHSRGLIVVALSRSALEITAVGYKDNRGFREKRAVVGNGTVCIKVLGACPYWSSLMTRHSTGLWDLLVSVLVSE
jgi:hypothetical protein